MLCKCERALLAYTEDNRGVMHREVFILQTRKQRPIYFYYHTQRRTYCLSKCSIFPVYKVRLQDKERSLFPWLARCDWWMVSECIMDTVRKVKCSRFFNTMVGKPYQFSSETQMATGQIKFLVWCKDHKCGSQGYLDFNKMKSSMCCFVLILQLSLSIYKPWFFLKC